ncbi:MAG: TIGR03557 family F420-dependent LLM class oxidoreductase [Frankiaceae bacterium]|nr:TIGR03557 family F420-dependent LLM class oxidoreductase [Frankiaceae bacterium]MBV9871141.1 TIGR03557 family F420-dependent LLM class oxidoreductase [Frankiaceae bacterium]
MTEFGYFLSAEELNPAALVAAGRQAVDAGFDRLWISDHYHPWVREQGESAFVWSVLGALATSTDARLTTAVTCPTDRIHPAVIAQAAATTASLAPGRFSLGVGTGERLNEHILGGLWPPAEIRLQRLEEAIEVMRKLWTGETITHRGEHYIVDAARIFSLPDEPPPVLVSGFGPKATKLAARVGDGWISTQPDAELLSLYRTSAGRGPTQAGMKICWAESADDAAKTAYRLWGFQGVGGQSSQDLPSWVEFETLAEASSPEQVAESIACGPDPERAAAKVQEYVDAGFDEVYIAQMGPDQAGGIAFITEKVLPLLK